MPEIDLKSFGAFKKRTQDPSMRSNKRRHRPRLLAVPFWIVERAREIAERKAGARRKKREETSFFARLFRAPSRLSRKGLLAV